MADDVDKMNLAFERVLECFKLQNLKDSQREALQNVVKGQDVFVIQPTGSGKSLIFQSAPSRLRHSKTFDECKVDRTCDFSPVISYARPRALP